VNGWTNVSPPRTGAGGACATHGVYEGRGCSKCRETSALAALRQAAWEATQFVSTDEVRSYVDGVMREVETDEP
jgi:hypothetical protein